MIFADDVLALVTGLEANISVSTIIQRNVDRENLPGKTDTSAVTHAVTEDFARNHMVVDEDRVQLLEKCQLSATGVSRGYGLQPR